MRLVLALGDRQTPVHFGIGQSDDKGFRGRVSRATITNLPRRASIARTTV
jgi:hypothetical protein